MGISTVSGPFRSKNGFQQLDENGEWVPVTGGGGGGASPVTVIYRTSTLTTYTLPAPTEVGQVYNIFVPRNATLGPSPSEGLVIFPTPFAGDSAAYMGGSIIVYTTINTLYATGPSDSGADRIFMYASDADLQASLQIVYLGSSTSNSYFEVMGSYLNNDILASNSRIRSDTP